MVAPALANRPASASQQTTQLSPRAAPPAGATNCCRTLRGKNKAFFTSEKPKFTDLAKICAARGKNKAFFASDYFTIPEIDVPYAH